jgi:hypothetical protein
MSERSERSGRIRLDEPTAWLLVLMLDRERIRLLVSRSEMREDGVVEGVSSYNARVVRIKRLQSELGRMMFEMGWLDEALSTPE